MFHTKVKVSVQLQCILGVPTHLVLIARLTSLGESLGDTARSRLTLDPRPPSAEVRNTNDGCLPIDEAEGGRELLMDSGLASVFIATILDFLLFRLDLLIQSAFNSHTKQAYLSLPSSSFLASSKACFCRSSFCCSSLLLNKKEHTINTLHHKSQRMTLTKDD